MKSGEEPEKEDKRRLFAIDAVNGMTYIGKVSEEIVESGDILHKIRKCGFVEVFDYLVVPTADIQSRCNHSHRGSFTANALYLYKQDYWKKSKKCSILLEDAVIHELEE